LDIVARFFVVFFLRNPKSFLSRELDPHGSGVIRSRLARQLPYDSPVSAVQPPAGIVTPHMMMPPRIAPKLRPSRKGFRVVVKIVSIGKLSTVMP
jgi:hypothetical protein